MERRARSLHSWNAARPGPRKAWLPRQRSTNNRRPVMYRPPTFPCPLATGSQHLGRPAARLLPSPCEPRHPTQRLEHLLHLNELLQQAIDLLNGGSAAPGDALAAAPVDDVLLATLLRRHGADDRFDAGHLLLVGLLVGQRLDAAQTREHSQNLVERTHLPNGPKLIAKIR